MEAISWISFKNQSSVLFGVMKQVPFIPTAERVVDTVEIPYSTPLTIKKGYKRIITPMFTLGIKDMSDKHIYNIYDWLRGEGRLTTSREPDVYFNAECHSALTVRRLSERLGEIDFTFTCDSFRYAVDNEYEALELTGDSQKYTTVNNHGNMTAYPEYEIECNAACTIWVNGSRYINLPDSGIYKINTEYLTVYKNDILIRVDPAMQQLVLEPGESDIITTNSVSSMKIKKNVRWL